MIELNNYQGDLTDVSAKKEALTKTRLVMCSQTSSQCCTTNERFNVLIWRTLLLNHCYACSFQCFDEYSWVVCYKGSWSARAPSSFLHSVSTATFRGTADVWGHVNIYFSSSSRCCSCCSCLSLMYCLFITQTAVCQGTVLPDREVLMYGPVLPIDSW